MTGFKEWNEHVLWVHERPRTDNGVWEESIPVRHHCEPFNYKNGCSEWPTCSWKDDGYCNGGNLPGAYMVFLISRILILEFIYIIYIYVLRSKFHHGSAIMGGIIDKDDESRNEGWRRWDEYENAIHDNEERENEEEHGNEERCELFDNPNQEALVCKIRRFEVIKHSFGEDEEYVAIKEHEYHDLTSTNEGACRTYQEIFRMMDEGRW
ncbi:hypothetical protein Tco_0863119 [Tanacetum coccineum]